MLITSIHPQDVFYFNSTKQNLYFWPLTICWVYNLMTLFIIENLFFDKRKSWKKSSFSENYLKLCSGAVYKTEMVFIYPCFYKYLSLLKIWPIIPRHFFKLFKIKIIMQNINCVKLTYFMMIFSLNKVW